MEIRVTPDQLGATGTRLQVTGTQLQEATGGFAQATGGLPEACGDPQAGAACEVMGTAWTRALLAIAGGIQQLGGMVAAGGDAYQTTDENAIPTPTPQPGPNAQPGEGAAPTPAPQPGPSPAGVN